MLLQLLDPSPSPSPPTLAANPTQVRALQLLEQAIEALVRVHFDAGIGIGTIMPPEALAPRRQPSASCAWCTHGVRMVDAWKAHGAFISHHLAWPAQAAQHFYIAAADSGAGADDDAGNAAAGDAAAGDAAAGGGGAAAAAALPACAAVGGATAVGGAAATNGVDVAPRSRGVAPLGARRGGRRTCHSPSASDAAAAPLPAALARGVGAGG